MAPGHLPFNLAIRIGQLARGPLGRPEDSELVVHHLLDRFTGADLTETLSRIKGTERKSGCLFTRASYLLASPRERSPVFVRWPRNRAWPSRGLLLASIYSSGGQL